MSRYFITDYAIDLAKDSLTVGTIKDVAVINQSIENIIFTVPGERVFIPTFGSPIMAVPFKNFSTLNGEQLLDGLIDAIRKWETRINIMENECRLYINPGQHSLAIKIQYSLKSDGSIAAYTKSRQL